jgi:sensor histidine kinase regulating citrate/malate metabolism
MSPGSLSTLQAISQSDNDERMIIRQRHPNGFRSHASMSFRSQATHSGERAALSYLQISKGSIIVSARAVVPV